MDAAVESAEESAEEKEVWFSGLVGDYDFESLKEMAASKEEIFFPGILYGWESKANALAHLKTQGEHAYQLVHKVLYHANTKAVAAAGGVHLLVTRYSAIIS